MTDLPAPFIERTRRLLGDDYPRFAEALESESPTSIRLNPSKSTPTGTIGDPVLWARHGFYLSSRPTFTFDPRLHAGAYYVQEAASMFLNRVIRQYVHEPVRYLDLCAAPGGKSTDAVASLPVGSLIVSNEVIPNRAHILAENIVKWGSPYCIVTRNEASAFGALEEYFDIIAADSAILLELENKMSKEYRQQHIGKTEEVLIEEIVSENGKDYFMGFTPDYIRVKIACDTALDNSEYINTIKKVYMKELSDDGIVVTGIFEC